MCARLRMMELQQRGDDGLALGIERAGGRWLAGLTVPVARIRHIAFDAVEMGVHPGAIGIVGFHDDLPDGGVGVRLASPLASKQSSKSRLIRVRTFCACG